MTTIIRSNVTLSAPRPGAMLLPSLGVAGATHRWHAETVSGKPGSAVSSVPDSIGNAPLTTVIGAVTLGETASGIRYLELGAGSGNGSTQNRITGSASGDNNEEFYAGRTGLLGKVVHLGHFLWHFEFVLRLQYPGY